MTVLACTWGSGTKGLPDGAEELLTVARRAGQALGLPLEWLHLGDLPAGVPDLAGRAGAAAVQHVAGERFGAAFEADAAVAALAQRCGEVRPALVILAQTFEARLVAPRLAGRIGAGVVMNGVDVERAAASAGRVSVTASAYGGDTRVVYEVAAGDGATAVVAVATTAVRPDLPAGPVDAAPVRAVAVDLGAVVERVRVVERAAAEGPKLEDAEIIVSGGRGLGKKENFRLVEELAAALGGMAGASRPIVDDGWAPSSRQVGLTGKITRPVLYVAAGISGASQHMAGCAAAKTLVAINTDKDAAIFRYARYGVVGDCTEVLVELTRAVKGG